MPGYSGGGRRGATPPYASTSEGGGGAPLTFPVPVSAERTFVFKHPVQFI